MAVEPEPFLKMYPEYIVPEDQKKAWFDDRTGAIVGKPTAERFGWKIGDRVPLISPIFNRPDGTPWTFTIRGIYTAEKKGVDDTQFCFNRQYLSETFRGVSFIEGNVGWFIIRVNDPANADQIAQRIDGLFANSANETKTATEAQFVQNFAKQIGDIEGFQQGKEGLLIAKAFGDRSQRLLIADEDIDLLFICALGPVIVLLPGLMSDRRKRMFPEAFEKPAHQPGRVPEARIAVLSLMRSWL